MSVVAKNIVENIASITFMDKEIYSNPVYTFNRVPPTIKKTVDKEFATGQEKITYTLFVKNNSAYEIKETITDYLSDGADYVVDSLVVDGEKVTPNLSDNVISFPVTVKKNATIKIVFQAQVEMLEPEPIPEV